MSRGNGAGRGRGWLNMYKNNPQPGIPEPQITPIAPKEAQTYVNAREDYVELVNRVKKFNVHDDGIMFNRKLKYFISGLKDFCQDRDEIKEAMEYIGHACLTDSELATNFVYIMCSQSMVNQRVYDTIIRHIFATTLQRNFEACEETFHSNLPGFRNCLHMHSEFYNKTRLALGRVHHFMGKPLMAYLDLLLTTNSTEDMKLFTTHLYFSGPRLKVSCPDQLQETLSMLRQILVSDRKLESEGKAWLMLALEVANNDFSMLPVETQAFYQDLLGDSAEAILQTNPEPLGNDVCLLTELMIPKANQQQTNPTVNPAVTPVDLNSTTLSSSSGISTDSSTNNLSNSRDNPRDNPSTGVRIGSKHGRPILGAGARFQKPKPGDSGRNSTDIWEDKRPIAPHKGGKGWEHDDRFETDYS